MRWIVFSLLLACSSAQADSAAVTQRRVLHQEVASWVKARDFERLSERSMIELRSQARFADGLWRASFLHAYFEHELAKTTRTDAQWKQSLDRLRVMAKRNPMDWIFYVEGVYALAWQIRGPDFGHEVSPKAMTRFRELMRHAREVLDQRKNTLSTSPLWYSRRITLALELSESAASQKALFDEAIREHPRYHGIYFARVRAVDPIWGGSKAAQLALLDELAALKGGAAEEGMYARVYWNMHADLFGNERTRSPALRQAMQSVVDEYPDEWNLLAFFLFSCQASDKSFARQLLPRLPARYIGELDISDEGGFRMCKDWASGKLVDFIMIKELENGEAIEVLVQ